MDNNNLTDRLKRYLNVTGAATGIATRIIGGQLTGAVDHGTLAPALRKALGNLKGPVMKIAQLVASIPNALPPEYAEELMKLQAHAPEMGLLFVKRRMRQELGEDWAAKFQSFSLTATAAASLGQVHQAIHLDGTALACKLQYPGMSAAVAADLQQLKVAGGVYEILNAAITTGDIQAEIADRLHEELDYILEAKHIHWYKQMLKDMPAVNIPHVYPELSTERLLTMSWLEGRPVPQFAAHAIAEQRNHIAQTLFRAWYIPFYHYGIIHGDPHLGNYTVALDGQAVNLLDFGCVRVFSPTFVQGVLDLYQALLHNDEDLAVHAYQQWGFPTLSKEIIAVLNLWARFLYAPLLRDEVCSILDTNNSAQGRALAEAVHQELARLGGVRPPREFVFMDRAAVGIGGAIMHLGAECNWHRLFEEIIARFDVTAVQERQAEVLSMA